MNDLQSILNLLALAQDKPLLAADAQKIVRYLQDHVPVLLTGAVPGATQQAQAFNMGVLLPLIMSTSLDSTGASGSLTRGYATAQGTATAAATFNIATQVPSGAKIIGVLLRTDVALASSDGGTTWQADYNGGSSVAITTGKAFAKNTKAKAFLDENAASAITTAATDITITCEGGKTFSAGGKITAVVFYELLTDLAGV